LDEAGATMGETYKDVCALNAGSLSEERIDVLLSRAKENGGTLEAIALERDKEDKALLALVGARWTHRIDDFEAVSKSTKWGEVIKDSGLEEAAYKNIVARLQNVDEAGISNKRAVDAENLVPLPAQGWMDRIQFLTLADERENLRRVEIRDLLRTPDFSRDLVHILNILALIHQINQKYN